MNEQQKWQKNKREKTTSWISSMQFTHLTSISEWMRNDIELQIIVAECKSVIITSGVISVERARRRRRRRRGGRKSIDWQRLQKRERRRGRLNYYPRVSEIDWKRQSFPHRLFKGTGTRTVLPSRNENDWALPSSSQTVVRRRRTKQRETLMHRMDSFSFSSICWYSDVPEKKVSNAIGRFLTSQRLQKSDVSGGGGGGEKKGIVLGAFIR